MTVETFRMKAKEKEITFSRPYLNDDKELTFLHCDAFSGFPNMEFILREEQNSIELRQSKSNKKVFLLLKGNERLLKEAVSKKEEILNLLRDFTKNMRAGNEKVLVFKTKSKDYPYYFTTKTVLEQGDKSGKFTVGFMYFINQHLKAKGEKIQFNDFDKMQETLGKHFKGVGFDQFSPENFGGEDIYTISFNQFKQLL